MCRLIIHKFLKDFHNIYFILNTEVELIGNHIRLGIRSSLLKQRNMI